jgi:hypothetical protein
MQKNVGGYERIARFVAGPVLVVVGLAALGGVVTLATGPLGLAVAAVLALVGAVLLTTAVTQKCPLNRALGLDTYRGDRPTDSSTDDSIGGRPS